MNGQKNEENEFETPEAQAGLLDKLRTRLELKNDAALAELIGVKASFVSDLRAGRRKFPLSAKLKILDKLGYLAARDALLSMTPQAFAERVARADNARISLDLSALDDTSDIVSKEFGEAVEAAIEAYGASAVATVVKTKIMEANLKASKK